MRAPDWLPALGCSFAVHAALAMLIDLPWLNQPNRPPIVHPIRISLGVATPRSSDAMASNDGAGASGGKAAAESTPSAAPALEQALELWKPGPHGRRPADVEPTPPPEPAGKRDVEKRVGESLASAAADRAREVPIRDEPVDPPDPGPDPAPEARFSTLRLRGPVLDPAVAESRTDSDARPNRKTMAGAAAAKQGIRAEYAAQVQLLLAHHRRYPRQARRRGQQGRARLFFVIDRHGRVVESRIEQSSGHALLDREVLAMVKRAQPLPPIPEPLFASNLDLIVPIEFSLR